MGIFSFRVKSEAGDFEGRAPALFAKPARVPLSRE